MDWTEWTLGIVGATIVGSLIWVAKILAGLPREYIPRSQVDRRFRDLEQRIHNDMSSQDIRNEKRLDKLEHAMAQGFQRVIDKLDMKADK